MSHSDNIIISVYLLLSAISHTDNVVLSVYLMTMSCQIGPSGCVRYASSNAVAKDFT